MRYFYSLTAHVAAVLWCRRILIDNRHLPFKCPQWWNVTKYIYSSIRPKQKKKMSLSILCSFTLQLYIWEGNIRLFTPLHLTVLVPGYSLGWPTSHAKQTIWNSFFLICLKHIVMKLKTELCFRTVTADETEQRTVCSCQPWTYTETKSNMHVDAANIHPKNTVYSREIITGAVLLHSEYFYFCYFKLSMWMIHTFTKLRC